MTFEVYWALVPTIGIGLCGVGWLALWVTRPRRMVTSDFDRVFA